MLIRHLVPYRRKPKKAPLDHEESNLSSFIKLELHLTMSPDDLNLLTAPNLAAAHGFTTRTGGVSASPYDSLNLGLSSGDAPESVGENRQRILEVFGVTQEEVCAFHQVHSARVIEGVPTWFEREADASVTNDPNLLLVVSVADCFPLLFHDPVKAVVGAAHCGWRGTVAGMAREVVGRMGELYGSSPQDIRVAIGPGISAACYQVGAEVVQEFTNAGFPEHVSYPDDEERFRLDLAAANRWALEQAGVSAEHIWSSDWCTYSDAARFYSHRRDAGKTGRHWAAIRLGGGAA